MICRVAWTALLFLCAEAMIQKGNFQATNTQWEYVAKFCFDTTGGTTIIDFDPSTSVAGQQVFLYDDLPDGFPSLYDSGNSCPYKRELSNPNVRIYTNLSVPAGGYVFNMFGMRPRWWYLVVANCDGPEQVNLDYTVTFTNKGGKYSTQFSFDEQGIFEAQIFTLICVIILIFLFGYSFKVQYSQNLRTHQLHAVMLAVMSLEFISLIMQLIHSSAYADDGVGHPNVLHAGFFFELLPKVWVTSLLVFIAKGWLISVGRLQDGVIRSISEIMVLYLGVTITLYAWSFYLDDPIHLQSVYQTTPGVILVSLRVIIFAWFISCLYATWRVERNERKKRFYVGFFFVGLIYFFTLPTALVLANHVADWYQRKAIQITEYILMLAMYFLLWFLFGPYGTLLKRTDDDEGFGRTSDVGTDEPKRKVLASQDTHDDDEFEAEAD